MTQKTNTISQDQPQVQEQLLMASPLSHDVKNAVLIVSVVANLAVFTTWIAIQVTSQYDSSLAALLFNS